MFRTWYCTTARVAQTRTFSFGLFSRSKYGETTSKARQASPHAAWRLIGDSPGIRSGTLTGFETSRDSRPTYGFSRPEALFQTIQLGFEQAEREREQRDVRGAR